MLLKQKKIVGMQFFVYWHCKALSESVEIFFKSVDIYTYSPGEVVCAHCTCMAGIGEPCSQIAALPFTAEA